MQGIVISVVSGKGGTGKTAFCVLAGMSLSLLGKKTLLLDCDIGLRNLDLALGLTDRALIDFTEVANGYAALENAVIKHDKLSNLYLLTAPVSIDTPDLDEQKLDNTLRQIRESFDFCIIDAGAGLGTSFRLATQCSDRAIVVATAEPSCLRNAQRTVMELQRYPTGTIHLVVNRVEKRLLRSLRANIDDAMDTAGLPLLGIIPEDDDVPVLLAKGKPEDFSYWSKARRAAMNIARRLCGNRVPLIKL